MESNLTEKPPLTDDDSQKPELKSTTNVTPIQHGPTHRNPKTKQLFTFLVALVLIIAAAAGGYYYRSGQAQTEENKQSKIVNQLQSQVGDLSKKLETEQAKSVAKTSTTMTTTAPTAAQLDNIKASITSKNTAALQGYMASTVKVIVAASEGIGDRTPAQAVHDVAYVGAGTNPWDFALPAATLNSYKAGFYTQYFPEGALVGKSANNYVISFSFNDSGKINTIFMTNDGSLLL
jgi:hypothetical protein